MRHLREKYSHDKKMFCALRSVYLALCEIDSDFAGKAINSFTKTVGTYAGTSRQVAGRYIRLLEQEGLIRQTRMRDPKTKAFLRGTTVEILSIHSAGAASKPLAGYPASGLSHRRDTPPTIRRKSIHKKKRMNNNVVEKHDSDTFARADHYADLIATEFGDQASRSFYRAACLQFSGAALHRKAREIIKDGGARKPAAVFTAWLLKKQQARRVQE